MQCYFDLLGLSGVIVFAGSVSEAKDVSQAITECFLVVEDLRLTVRERLSQSNVCWTESPYQFKKKKHFSGCVLVVERSLVDVPFGIHDVSRRGQGHRIKRTMF